MKQATDRELLLLLLSASCRAENNDNVFLTVELSDAEEIKIELKEDSVTFSAKSQGKDYSLDLKLKKKIQPEVRNSTAFSQQRLLLPDLSRQPADADIGCICVCCCWRFACVQKSSWANKKRDIEMLLVKADDSQGVRAHTGERSNNSCNCKNRDSMWLTSLLCSLISPRVSGGTLCWPIRTRTRVA